MSENFTPDNNGNIFSQKNKVLKTNVLKNNSVKLVPESKVISQKHQPGLNKSKVSPIMNNENIIGVMTECACGEVIKIYFNYESENNSEITD